MISTCSRWLLVAGFAGLCAHASANGLLGATVSYTGYCCTAPIPADIVTNTATAVVGPGVEFPIGAIFGPAIPDSLVDVSAYQVSVTVFTTYSNTSYQAGAFDGGVLTFSGPSFTKIIGVTVDPVSTFVPVSVDFTDDRIIDNVAGLPFSSGALTVLDIQLAPFADTPVPVPEPPLIALTTAGLAALLFAQRPRERRSGPSRARGARP